MLGGCHFTLAQSRVLGPCWRKLIAIKDPASPTNTPIEEAKCEDLEKVIIGNDLKRFFWVGSQLPSREKEGLTRFLKKNVDVFVWDTYDSPRVDPNFICHHLNVDPSATPKK